MVGILLKHWTTILFIAIITMLSVWMGILKLEIDHEKMTALTIQTDLSKKRAIAEEHARKIENEHATETLTLANSYANTITAIREESDRQTKNHSGIRCTFSVPDQLRHTINPQSPTPTHLHTTPNTTPTTQKPTPNTLATQSLPSTQQLMSLPRQCAETTAGYLALQKFAIEECGAR